MTIDAGTTTEPCTEYLRSDPSTLMVKTDKLNSLAMYHHELLPNCSGTETVENEKTSSEKTTPEPKNVDMARRPKGLATCDNDQTILMHTSVYNHEYDIDAFTLEEEKPDFDYTKATILLSEEGTLLRVFCYDDKWNVSTHRKLDARNSRWGCSTNFYELFVQALQVATKQYQQRQQLPESFDIKTFFDRLDPKYVYTFMLRNNDHNRLVCKAPDRPVIYFSGKYSLYPLPDVDPKTADCTALPVPIPILDDWDIPEIPIISRYYDTVYSHKDLKEIVNGMSCYEHQGVIVFHPSGVFKLLCKQYEQLRKLRNNCPNLMLRYSQLRHTKHVRAFRELFHGLQNDFTHFENTLYNISHYISAQYVNRYVRKEYAAVTPLQYRIIKQLRSWYLMNPNTNRVTPTRTRQFIEAESPLYIYKLVAAAS